MTEKARLLVTMNISFSVSDNPKLARVVAYDAHDAPRYILRNPTNRTYPAFHANSKSLSRRQRAS
jgi:hypothetical protein